MTQLGRRASVQEEKDLNFPQRKPKIVKIADIAVFAEFLRGWGWRTGPLQPQRQPKFVKISLIFCFIVLIQQYSLIFEVLKAATWFSR